MTRGKWMLLLALLLGTILLIGCGSDTENKEEPKTEQQADQNKAEEPKAEAPKAEEPKAEAPKAEEPKTEAPKTEAPKTEAPKTEAPKTEAPKTEAPKASGIPALNLAHELRDNCAMCHTGAALLTTKKPSHVIDGNTAACKTCHTLNPK